jgi:hypothetical protein
MRTTGIVYNLDAVFLTIARPVGGTIESACDGHTLIKGDSEINFVCNVRIPPSPFGTFTLQSIILRDFADEVVFDTAELFALGFPTTFQHADLSGQPDADNDGVPDANDNCPNDQNTDQSDVDLDGIGTTCDPRPNDPRQELPDDDGDAVADIFDNCPQDPNADQADLDIDRVGDVCDNCIPLANRSQIDGDENGIGDVCDALADFVGPGEVSSEEFEALVAEVAALEARIAALEAGSPQCPDSDGSATVCTILDLILQALRDAGDRDDFIRSVALLTRTLLNDGLITAEQAGIIRRAASQVTFPPS